MSANFKLGKDVPIDSLPFSHKKQQAIIGHALKKEQFFRQCRDRISSGYFYHPHDQKIWQSMQQFHIKYGRCPHIEEIQESPSVMPEDPATKLALRSEVNECLSNTTSIGVDVLESELTEWLQAKSIQNMIEEGVNLYNSQKLTESIELFKGKIRDISDIRFFNDLEMSPHDYAAVFECRKEEMNDAVSFGASAIDRVINKDAKHGSLMKKEMTLLIAPPNIGKTRTMITTLRYNALERQKNCLFIFHEGNSEEIYSQIFAALITRPGKNIYVTPQQVREVLYNNDTGKKWIEEAVQVWSDHICFIPWVKAGLTIEEIIPTIRRKQDEWASKHGGRGFDLIIDDYPALLTTNLASRGNLQRRHIDFHIYLQFSQLGIELGAHTLLAIQANREGSKAMRGRHKDQRHRLLTREDVEEAWGPTQPATNIITINRDENMERNGGVIYLIDKSRSNETGWAVMCRSRYDVPITHHDALGATWYRGTGSYSNVASSLLDQYNDQAVPTEALIQAQAAS